MSQPGTKLCARVLVFHRGELVGFSAILAVSCVPASKLLFSPWEKRKENGREGFIWVRKSTGRPLSGLPKADDDFGMYFYERAIARIRSKSTR
jgi:hypothetical protein